MSGDYISRKLVDADKMIWKLTPDEEFYPTEEDRLDYDSGMLMVRDIRGFIRDQETIIPADGKDTDVPTREGGE